MQSIHLIRYLSAISTIAPIILGLSFYQYLKIDHKIILLFLFLAGCFDIFLYITTSSNTGTLLAFHIFTQIEFVSISLFYFINLKQFFNLKFLIILNSIGFLIIFFISFLLTPTTILDSFSSIFEHLFFIGLSFLLIFKNSFSNGAISKNKTSTLLNYLFLVYFSLSFFIFLFGNLFTEELFLKVWIINSIITIFSNLFIAFALWKSQEQTKS